MLLRGPASKSLSCQKVALIHDNNVQYKGAGEYSYMYVPVNRDFLLTSCTRTCTYQSSSKSIKNVITTYYIISSLFRGIGDIDQYTHNLHKRKTSNTITCIYMYTELHVLLNLVNSNLVKRKSLFTGTQLHKKTLLVHEFYYLIVQ